VLESLLVGKLVAVRHCITNNNARKVYNGIIETPDAQLNAAGKKQAKNLADKYRNAGIDIILCSPQNRAKDTAKIIAGEINAPICIVDGLCEVGIGEHEGKIEQNIRLALNMLSGAKGTEKWADFIARNHKLCEMYETYMKGKNVLVVTHWINSILINHLLQPVAKITANSHSKGKEM
jgi:probable phosphoglycerate mutase